MTATPRKGHYKRHKPPNVSAATLYSWRRAYGGMDAEAAKELKELREQNAGSSG